MPPILASSYGNAFLLLFCVPACALALLVGIVARITRTRALVIACGVFCLIAGGFMLLSLREGGDRTFTVYCALAGIVPGVLLLVFQPRPRPPK